MKIISIIMPAYNAERFITEAIQSVLNQDYKYFELLIINDGSTDETANQIQVFTDERIRYFVQDNAGVSAARNRGLAEMGGDFFCFLDADDVMPTQSLSSRIALFADSQTNYVDGRVYDMNENGVRLSSGYIPDFKGNPLPLLLRLDQRCFLGNTWMIRRNTHVDYAFDKSLKYCEDLDFYIQMVRQQQGEYTTTANEILYYRRSEESAMANYQGLADGYRRFFDKCKQQGILNFQQSIYLRYRIMRIMFLSFLFGKKDVKNAIAMIFKFMRP